MDSPGPPPRASVVLRGHVVSSRGDPAFVGDGALVDIDDGVVVIADGRIRSVEPYATWRARSRDTEVVHYPECLLVPGFVDAHVHYAQTPMVASFGAHLLDWLSTYTFPNEMRFRDPVYARAVAQVFFDELLRNGTTSALVFCTVFRDCADAFFEEAFRRNLRVIGGKVLMDRNAPAELTDTVASGYDDSRALIERWHGRGRLGYAITPRFAPTSSDAQLRSAATLKDEFPDCLVHTHVAENAHELAWVHELFPDRAGYLDVYDHAGLLGPGTVLAHGVHLSDAEFDRLGESTSALAHCPTSNTFLGSGLFSFARAKAAPHPVTVALGTDIGAGTSFSLLATMGEAYKVGALSGAPMNGARLFYLATLAGATALRIDHLVGSLEVGKEADVVVLDPHASSLLRYRAAQVTSTEELLFLFATLGDDRCVAATYVEGHLAYRRANAEDPEL